MDTKKISTFVYSLSVMSDFPVAATAALMKIFIADS